MKTKKNNNNQYEEKNQKNNKAIQTNNKPKVHMIKKVKVMIEGKVNNQIMMTSKKMKKVSNKNKNKTSISKMKSK